MAQRIKGQEVEVLIIARGVVQTNLTAVKSFSFTFQQEIKSEGYLGETTNRKDSIFNGIAGEMEYNFTDKAIFDLIGTITDKAQRRTAGIVINVKATMNFPDGTRARVIIPDVEFGELPVNFGSRSDYGAVRMPFEASNARVIS